MPTADDWSRRQWLQAAGTVTASLGTAGCTSLLPPVGQEVRYGRVEAPAQGNDASVYRRWMPARSELGALPETDGYENWIYVTPDSLGAETLGGEFRIGADVALASLDYVGYEFGSYDHVLALPGLGTVVETPVERGPVDDTLDRTRYEDDGTYGGYDLFTRSDIPRLVAVSDSAVVQTRGRRRQQKAELLVDTRAGERTRRHAADGGFDAFSEWVGAHPTVMSGFPAATGDVAPEHSVFAYTFDDETGYFLINDQYESGETPSESEVRRRLESEMERAVRAYSVDVELSAPRVAVEMRVDPGQFEAEFTQDRPPFVTWGVTEGDGTVVVHHEAGDPVPVDQTEVHPGGALLTSPEEGTSLGPGDRLAFDAAALSGESIRVVYQFAGSEHSTLTLFHHDADS
jgi:hypothetical protein